MALAPVIKHAWAIQRVRIDLAPLIASYAAPPTVVDVTVQSVAPTGLGVTAGGVAGAEATLMLAAGDGGVDYVAEFAVALGSGEAIAASLPVRVRERIHVNRVDVAAAPIPVPLDPDGAALHGIDWSRIGEALGTTIAAHEWVLESGLVAEEAAVAAGAHQARFSASPGASGLLVAESRVTFANGDRDARSILFEVVER